MHRTISFSFTPNQTQQTMLQGLTYAASKLWNVGNYERKNWTKDSNEPYPDWYRQKKTLNTHFWYKALPSQSAQEVLKQLHEAWKSFYQLKTTGGVANPKPPRFKHRPFNIRFLNNGFKRQDRRLRLSLPKQLKQHLANEHQIEADFLYIPIPKTYLHVPGNLKMIEIIPCESTYQVNMIVELPDAEDDKRERPDVYMSIDLGVNNLMTCYVSTGKTFILSGRQMLAINRYFDKTIRHYQSIAHAQQAASGKQYLSSTKRVRQLYEKRRKQVKHFLHTATKKVADIAAKEGVTHVIIGDMSNIREAKSFGRKTNQKFHRLPYHIIEEQLAYKLQDHRIQLIKQEESYTSQCSPYSGKVSRDDASKNNRQHRGLYAVEDKVFNADCVGAYNILRKYLCRIGKPYPAVVGLDTPVMYRWKASSGFSGNPKLAISMAM